MSYPETFDDLPDYRKRDHEIVSLDTSKITQLPIRLAKAMLDILAAAEDTEIYRGDDTLYLPLTEEEKKRELESAQRSWFYGRDAYAKAKESPSSVESYMRYPVDVWAQENNQEPIQWEE